MAQRREQSGGVLLDFQSLPQLTTGAALLDGTREAVQIPIGFQAGMQVRHPRYGRGTILSTEGFGGRRTVTVQFESSPERRTFVAAKCPLQPIGR